MPLPDPETLASEYLAGVSLEALCARYGVGRLKMKASLIEHGVAIRGGGGWHGTEHGSSFDTCSAQASESWRLEAFRQLLVRAWRRQLLENAQGPVSSSDPENPR